MTERGMMTRTSLCRSAAGGDGRGQRWRSVRRGRGRRRCARLVVPAGAAAIWAFPGLVARKEAAPAANLVGAVANPVARVEVAKAEASRFLRGRTPAVRGRVGHGGTAGTTVTVPAPRGLEAVLVDHGVRALYAMHLGARAEASPAAPTVEEGAGAARGGAAIGWRGSATGERGEAATSL